MWNQIRLRRADSESSLSPGDANATEFQMRTSVSVPVFSPSCWAMNTISFQPGYGLALVSNFRISLESLTSWFSMCALFSPSVREWNKGPNKHKQNQTQFIIFNQRGSQTQARGSPGARQETNKTNKQTNKNNCWLTVADCSTVVDCGWLWLTVLWLTVADELPRMLLTRSSLHCYWTPGQHWPYGIGLAISNRVWLAALFSDRTSSIKLVCEVKRPVLILTWCGFRESGEYSPSPGLGLSAVSCAYYYSLERLSWQITLTWPAVGTLAISFQNPQS